MAVCAVEDRVDGDGEILSLQVTRNEVRMVNEVVGEDLESDATLIQLFSVVLRLLHRSRGR